MITQKHVLYSERFNFIYAKYLTLPKSGLLWFTSLKSRLQTRTLKSMQNQPQQTAVCSLDTSLAILLSSVLDEIADTAGVTPLIVVPGDELDEVGAELDASLGVED